MLGLLTQDIIEAFRIPEQNTGYCEMACSTASDHFAIDCSPHSVLTAQNVRQIYSILEWKVIFPVLEMCSSRKTG